jgi:aerobic C4-dicarboxylate transport protein
VPIAVFELNGDKEFWKHLGRTILLLVAAVAAFTLAGVLAAAISRPDRIPLVGDANPAGSAVGLRDILLAVFPDSLFKVLGSGDFLLPVYLLAVLLGLALSFDRAATKPVALLLDSLSRIFYQINSFFAEFLGVLVIAVAANNVFALRTASRPEVYRPLLLLVGVEVLVAAFVLIPAALWFLGGKKNPFRVVYALLGPAVAALVSGDVYFSLGALIKHGKESLGIRRRANLLAMPLALIFGRAGTSLVTATAFIVVLSSYSNLGVSLGSLLWIIAVAPFLTLLLGSAPDRGTMTALMTLCALYGKGFENGYLIIVPIALPLIAAGAFLDCLWAGAAALILARRDGMAVEKEARFFI